MLARLKQLILPFLAIGMLGYAVFHILTAEELVSELKPPSVPAQALSVERVAGTGVVEPKSETVSVGTARDGILLELYYTAAKVGTRVELGEPLFRVDDRAWRAQLDVHKAGLASAEASLLKFEQQPRPEDLPPLEAHWKAAQARLADVQDRLTRAEQMPAQAISREEVTQRRFAFQAAKHEAEQAEKELARVKAGAWSADIAVARAAVEVAKANIAMVETEIERCLVRAPIAGEILQVNVRPGEFVSGQSEKSLFLLGDMSELHVRVEFDEEDIARFRAELTARAMLRGDARESFPLRFIRVEPFVLPKRMLSGSGAERVDTRVLPVIYAINASDSKQALFVGQQLDVFCELTKPN